MMWLCYRVTQTGCVTAYTATSPRTFSCPCSDTHRDSLLPSEPSPGSLLSIQDSAVYLIPDQSTRVHLQPWIQMPRPPPWDSKQSYVNTA